MGRLDNDRPGMVWLLAIGVPVAVASSRARFLENDGPRAFLPGAM
jgi:hypothetical protein